VSLARKEKGHEKKTLKNNAKCKNEQGQKFNIFDIILFLGAIYVHLLDSLI
jgi:hypothetical protein